MRNSRIIFRCTTQTKEKIMMLLSIPNFILAWLLASHSARFLAILASEKFPLDLAVSML